LKIAYSANNAAYLLISDAPHVIEIEWKAATAAGANNGVMTLWLDGVQKSSVTNIDNDTRRINYVCLGQSPGLTRAPEERTLGGGIDAPDFWRNLRPLLVMTSSISNHPAITRHCDKIERCFSLIIC